MKKTNETKVESILMGVCMSHEDKIRQLALNHPPNYAKEVRKEAPLAPEHTIYDYEQVRQPSERLAVLSCPHARGLRPDRLVIVDLDETSPTYCKIISNLEFPSVSDQPGRMNWTRSGSDLDSMKEIPRTHLVVPCMNTNRIYIIALDGTDMKIVKIIESDILSRYDVSCPYAVHTLPIKGAPVHVSTMGDKNGHGKGDFILIDRHTFEVRERKNREVFAGFGGDFCLQTRHNLLIACEWGHPRLFQNGFSRCDIEKASQTFGNSLHVWKISPGQLRQTIELDSYDGCLTTTVRFLHNPDCNHAFACSALGSAIFHIHMDSVQELWKADKISQIAPLQVENWLSPEMPALLTDLVISMDDRLMYVAGWLHGIVWQYDISDPFRISLRNKIVLGGLLTVSSAIRIKIPQYEEDHNDVSSNYSTQHEDRSPPQIHGETVVKDTIFRGGPASLQLSLDGKRLYVANSFYKHWDAQFYPDLIGNGGQIIRVDISSTTSLSLNETFLLDMKDIEGGPFVARDLRFIGGDSTSDNFL